MRPTTFLISEEQGALRSLPATPSAVSSQSPLQQPTTAAAGPTSPRDPQRTATAAAAQPLPETAVEDGDCSSRERAPEPAATVGHRISGVHLFPRPQQRAATASAAGELPETTAAGVERSIRRLYSMNVYLGDDDDSDNEFLNLAFAVYSTVEYTVQNVELPYSRRKKHVVYSGYRCVKHTLENNVQCSTCSG